MLRTFEAPFDFHPPQGGRRHFAKFASALSERFDAASQIIDDPIFSYRRWGRSQLDRLCDLDETRPAIVYLSNVVMHSAILILGEVDASALTMPFCYDSLASFITAPYCRGFHVGRDRKVTAGFDDTTVVVSDLARFRKMDDDELPNDGLFRVLHYFDDVFLCNILDYDRYFDHVALVGDEPFFLNASSNVNYGECINHLRRHAS